jgi:hypothetical protein
MNSEPRTLAGALADTLDGLDVAACIFDAGDRSLLWNRTFLTLFPEHAFKVYEGEHYSENLRRFYSARLSEAELANIDDYIKKGLERHRMYDNPYQFDHQGCLIRVTTMSLLDGCRIRMRRVLEHGQTEVLQHDNPINQWVITTLLAKHGVQMTLVGDGQQALEALMVDQPVIPLDLVLMDLQMPVLDGCSATRQLRAWEAQTGRAPGGGDLDGGCLRR